MSEDLKKKSGGRGGRFLKISSCNPYRVQFKLVGGLGHWWPCWYDLWLLTTKPFTTDVRWSHKTLHHWRALKPQNLTPRTSVEATKPYTTDVLSSHKTLHYWRPFKPQNLTPLTSVQATMPIQYAKFLILIPMDRVSPGKY